MRYVMFFFVMIINISNMVLAVDQNIILGKWQTEGAKSQVEIYSTGEKYSGKIVWLKEPCYEKGDEMAGRNKVDRRNPDVKLRNLPLVGREIVNGFFYDNNAGKWINGKIYNPEDGQTYNCYLELQNYNKLTVRGSLDSWGIIGKTQIWDRVTSDVKVK